MGHTASTPNDQNASCDSSTTVVGSSDDGEDDDVHSSLGNLNDGQFDDQPSDAEARDRVLQASETMRAQSIFFGGSRHDGGPLPTMDVRHDPNAVANAAAYAAQTRRATGMASMYGGGGSGCGSHLGGGGGGAGSGGIYGGVLPGMHGAAFGGALGDAKAYHSQPPPFFGLFVRHRRGCPWQKRTACTTPTEMVLNQQQPSIRTIGRRMSCAPRLVGVATASAGTGPAAGQVVGAAATAADQGIEVGQVARTVAPGGTPLPATETALLEHPRRVRVRGSPRQCPPRRPALRQGSKECRVSEPR